METVFFEPESIRHEIRNGVVYVEFTSGARTFRFCTTIHGLRTSVQKAKSVLDAFDRAQSGRVKRMRRKK